MSRKSILENLRSTSPILNEIAKDLITISFLEKPTIGYTSFKDIEHNFHFLLNEYKTNKEMKYEKWSIKTLLDYFNISKKTYTKFQIDINHIFASYQSTDIDILEVQIDKYANSGRDDTSKEKMKEKLRQDRENNKHTYAQSLMRLMESTGINQCVNNEYIAISKLFEIYDMFLDNDEDFKEKKKYLQKHIKKDNNSNNDFSPDIYELLHKYIKELYLNTLDTIDDDKICGKNLNKENIDKIMEDADFELHDKYEEAKLKAERLR